MKVILRSDRDVGKRGDIVEVSDGYARNFLCPTGSRWWPPTARCHRPRDAARPRPARRAGSHGGRADRPALVPKIITISAKSGPEGKFYGSVTMADVVQAVEAQTGVVLDRRSST